MHYPALLLVCLLLCGCSNFTSYFRLTAGEGLVVGMEAPPPELNVNLGAAVTSTAFVAQARSLSSVANNLVDDAEGVWVDLGEESYSLSNVGDGLYEASTAEAPSMVYQPGEEVVLTVLEGGVVRTATAIAPAVPTLGDFGEGFHTAGQPLVADLTGQGYSHFLAVVTEVQADGNVVFTYDSRPETAGDYVDWVKGADGVQHIEIPGSAFPNPNSTYVVGVGGLVVAADSAFLGMNPIVSNLAVGAMTPAAIVTAP